MENASWSSTFSPTAIGSCTNRTQTLGRRCATMTGIPANAACHLHLCPDNCRPCIAAHVPVPPNMMIYTYDAGYASSSLIIMPHIPSEWALSVTHKASEFVAQQCLAYIYDFPPVPIPEIDLLTYMACCQLARVLAAAYMNPSKCRYLPCLMILTRGGIVQYIFR